MASISAFSTTEGTEELYLTLFSNPAADPANALEQLCDSFEAAKKEHDLTDDALCFSRFFFSDIANQHEVFRRSRLCNRLQSGALSLVEQRPCTTGQFALLCYFVSNKHIIPSQTLLFKKCENRLSIQGTGYSLFFAAGLSANHPFDAGAQTAGVFQEYGKILQEQNQTLLENTLRTWIFVRDIDNHYKGMTEARKLFFIEQNLTEKTRYLASTGIEAKLEDSRKLVSLDALSIGNIQPEQIIRMEALGNLCPAHSYGVTFERGTRVQFGDRAHLYISGTASIDHQGEVLHPGDVVKQTKRTLDNIEALLKPNGATLEDMMYFILYIRNWKEAPAVIRLFHERVSPRKPFILVEASVCRASWLVEIEGMAVIPSKAPYPPFL